MVLMNVCIVEVDFQMCSVMKHILEVCSKHNARLLHLNAVLCLLDMMGAPIDCIGVLV